MADPLLISKVSLPKLRHIFVPRIKVLRKLSEGFQDGHLLTLVSAPAGYGKTTSIRIWVEEAGYPVAWLTLEKSDSDLKQFLRYFLTALQLTGEDLGQEALEVVQSMEIDLQLVLRLLINDLVKLNQPILLVLEEYHLIENDQIDKFLDLLLNQAIQNLHLVIATREDPNLPLTRLRVRNQLTEIRAADLSFSLEETEQFFSDVMGIILPIQETKILKNRTEGWIAGLQLAALSLKENKDTAKFVEAFRGTHRHVLDYLIDEVLNGLPEETQVFLRRTSILDQLSASLCEAVTGLKASGKYLNELENNNLFLVSLDEERNWFRYHALFADLLKNQLLHVERECVDELNERAADWYQENGFIHKAVEHALKISNSKTAAHMIEKYAIPMLYKGEVSAVAGWFEKLPESLIQSSPMMCVSKAWALALMHSRLRMNDIETVLKMAKNASNRVDVDEGLRNLVDGHIASIQAYTMQSLAFEGDQPLALIETSQKAQRLLPEDEKAIRSVNYLNIGYGQMALTNLPDAVRAYNQAFEDGIAGGNWFAAVYGQIDVIVIDIMKGQINEALDLCEVNIDRFNRFLAGQRFPPIADLYNLMGGILLEKNRLDEAEHVLTQSMSLIRLTGEVEARLRCFQALVRLRWIQKNWAGVLDGLAVLEDNCSECISLAQALRHRLALRGPNVKESVVDEAKLWIMQTVVKFETFPDISTIDFANRVQFQIYLCMAHILVRLASRDPRSHSLLEVNQYFARQEQFAEAHELFDWLIAIWIVRALIYYVENREEDAFQMIQTALQAAEQHGYCRIFLDEVDLLRPLLQSIGVRLKEHSSSVFIRRLLASMPEEFDLEETHVENTETLSDRELEVLRCLAAGDSYKEIGQTLFLSLNTVQFHVKSIYRKLMVNKRLQAIEKAREMNLI